MNALKDGAYGDQRYKRKINESLDDFYKYIKKPQGIINPLWLKILESVNIYLQMLVAAVA